MLPLAVRGALTAIESSDTTDTCSYARWWHDDAQWATDGTIHSRGIEAIAHHYRKFAETFSEPHIDVQWGMGAPDGGLASVEFVLRCARKVDATLLELRILTSFVLRNDRIVTMRQVATPSPRSSEGSAISTHRSTVKQN